MLLLYVGIAIGIVVGALIRDFLRHFNLDYTLCVFDPEAEWVCQLMFV